MKKLINNTNRYFHAPRNGLERYVNDVRSGKILTCKWIKLAVDKFIYEYENQKELGFEYRENMGNRFMGFSKLCQHSKGKWAGKPIIFEDWQEFFLRLVFSWYMIDTGCRRFSTLYIEVGRKNGKSLLASVIALYMLVADGEGGAEIYSVATKKDQARIVFDSTVAMVKQNPAFADAIRVKNTALHFDHTFAKFEPLSKDSNKMDGLNVHLGIMDEIHAMDDHGIYEKINTAMGSREQPLLLGITTAGFDKTSLCYDLNTYTRDILDGRAKDDSFLGLLYTLDDGDDYNDEANWVKGNPNINVSKFVKTIRQGYVKAMQMPSYLNAWLTLELNVWTDGKVRWIAPDEWESLVGYVLEKDGGNTREGRSITEYTYGCKEDLGDGCRVAKMEDFAGKPCFVGLDLSSVADITAIYVLFLSDNGKVFVFPRFYIPKARVEEHVKKRKVAYDVWIKQGWLMTTPTQRIDQKTIVKDLLELDRKYDINYLGYDVWNAAYIATEVEEAGIDPVMVRQGWKTMSPAAKELEAMIYDKRVFNDGNPVMNWMMGNVVMEQDSAGNIKPSKKESSEKIDGVAALLTAIAVALTQLVDDKVSIYEERGFTEL